MKVLNLTRCPSLTRTPSFFAFPALERFVLTNCQGLKEINWSIGELKSLNYLKISNGRIEDLLFSNYDNIEDYKGYSPEMQPQPRLLPDSIGGLTSLTVLKIYNAGLTKLHPSVGELMTLKHLCLRCPQLKNLPNSIGQLTSLLQLDLSFSVI